MASWTRLDTDIYSDSDFNSLWLENTAFPWLFTALVAIAKKAADVDPDTWQGHLVSPSGRALSEDELIKILPRIPRAHDKTCQQFFNSLRRLRMIVTVSLHECDAIGAEPEQLPDIFDTRRTQNSTQFVMQISDWFRWFQRPEKPAKSSTERSRRRRQRLAQEAMQRDARNGATPPTDKTDKTDRTHTTDATFPPTPRGDGADFLEDESADPESLPPDPRGSELASSDPEKFSSMLTRDQFSALRGRTLREVVHNLAPGGLAYAQQQKLLRYLETKPPKGWREGPGRWADHLFYFVTQGVQETREKLAEKRNHGIGNPSAVAIGRAQALLAEFAAELGAA